MDSSTRQRLDRSKNLVGFQLGDVSYAVEIANVREIINPLPVVTLPHAPPAVIGVADHRGEVVPVVDLRARFGLPPVEPTRRTKWIIIRFDDRSVGLVVDAVTDVFGAGPADARAVPKLGGGEESRAIQAVFAQSGGLVFVLDVHQVSGDALAFDAGALARLVQGAQGDD